MKLNMYYVLQGTLITFLLIGCFNNKKRYCKIASYERIFLYIGTFLFPIYPLVSALFTIEGTIILEIYNVIYSSLNYLSRNTSSVLFSIILIFAVLLNYALMVLLVSLELSYIKKLDNLQIRRNVFK